jgi:dTDP-4-dehydrorhamnose 3,5-epimerase
MEFIKAEIPDVVLIKPKVFGDSRGYFMESFRSDLFTENIGEVEFIQDNESKSAYGVLRGLHYQLPPYAQAKLVRVITGRILDVAVDIRQTSPTYGRHVNVELSEDNKHQLYIPQGFAHGFVVLSDEAIVTYKVDTPYAPDHEAGIYYADPALGIDWGLPESAIRLSEKDGKWPGLGSREYGVGSR